MDLSSSISNTSVSPIEFHFDWTINNFETYSQIGQLLQSSSFRAPDKESEWCLQMHPYGDSPNNFAYMSVYLLLMTCSAHHVEANLVFTLYEENGEKKYSKSLKNQKFQKGSRIGFPKLYRRFYTGHQHFNSLLHETFRLRCEIQIINQPAHTVKESHFQLAGNLYGMFRNQIHCDVVLNANGREFHAHKCVLAARSPVFAAMFEHDMKEKSQGVVEIPDINPEAMDGILQFLYIGRAANVDRLGSEILYAADKYLLKDLKLFCEQELTCKLSIDNVIEMLSTADSYNADTLKKNCIQFITSNHSKIVNIPELKALAKSRPLLIYDLLVAFSKEWSKDE